jgi:hypothetical protein
VEGQDDWLADLRLAEADLGAAVGADAISYRPGQAAGFIVERSEQLEMPETRA